MKKIILAVSAAAIFMAACKSDETNTATATEPVATAPATTFDPDPTDTIPGDGYPAYCSDTAIASMLAASIREAEKDNLSGLTNDDRKFKYHAFDLNNDGKDEYVVALYKPFWCGSGGCTAYIFGNDGKVDTRFTVVRFPIYVAASVSDGWQDLIVYSGSENRFARRKAGKYPSNPSTEEVAKGEIPNMAPALVNIWEGGAYPAFSF